MTLLVKKGDMFDRELKTNEALAAYLEAEKLSADDAEIVARDPGRYLRERQVKPGRSDG